MENGDIYEQITAKYNQFSKVEQRIADYVLRYRHMMQPMTSAQVAEACGVSIASVTRFCRTIGKANFAELKWSVSAALASSAAATGGTALGLDATGACGEVCAEDSIGLKCQKLCRIGIHALTQALEKIDPEAVRAAVDLLSGARSVYCFGQGNSSVVASDAWGRFNAVAPKFHWISDTYMQEYTAAQLGEGDVVLYFSFSGATRALREIGSLLEETQAKLILVTRFPNSPGALLSDVVLLCGVNETPRNQETIAAKIGQLFVIDVLFNEYCAQNLELVIKNQEKVRAAELRHF